MVVVLVVAAVVLCCVFSRGNLFYWQQMLTKLDGLSKRKTPTRFGESYQMRPTS